MSSADQSNSIINGNSNALTEYLESLSENDKRSRVPTMNEELQFPSMKRSKIEGQHHSNGQHHSAITPQVNQNSLSSFPFFGTPSQSTPQPQHYQPALMNPHSNPAVQAAAAAHAAMTAFIAQSMMGQHHQKSQAANPMQNFMASYASMMNTGAPANGPVSVSNGSVDSSALPSEVSCPTPPTGNISASGPMQNGGTSNPAIPNHNFSMNTTSPTPHQLMNANPVVSATPKISPTNGVGLHNTTSNSKVVGLPQSLAANPFLNMRDLSLEELEEFVRQLQEANQPIPQPLSMLLNDARRKEQKKNAKRVANRKSACTSRARKKAYLEEMQRTNRKLRRQALILALLPDLVVALSSDCEISFISAQVERVLRYNPDDLVGADMMDLLVPASREALRRLVNKLLQPEATAAATTNDNPTIEKKKRETKTRNIDRNNSPPVSAGSAGENTNSTSEAVVISEQSFPLSVVQVKSSVKMNEEDGTDDSGNGNDKVAMSSITCSRYSSSNSNDSSNHNNSLDEDNNQRNKKDSSTSDDSSSDSKNLRKANEALNRNVQLHNAKLCKENENSHRSRQHTDDVTGATVTANNADARLSSLQHRPSDQPKEKEKRIKGQKKNDLTFETQSNSSSSNSLLEGVEDNRNGASKLDGGDRETTGNSSDDSGYGEGSDSFPSREDSSSSDNEDENSSEARKPKPLAPTCTVCLVRVDLTTIWCEVTASIRTNTAEDEMDEPVPQPPQEKNKKNVQEQTTAAESDTEKIEKEVKEVLLCLRPLRDGDKVGEELRFNLEASKKKCQDLKTQKQKKAEATINTTANQDVVNVSDNVSSSVNSANSSGGQQSITKKMNIKGLPFKKRTSVESKARMESESKKQKHSISLSTSDTEKSVVESLMLMCNKPKK